MRRLALLATATLGVATAATFAGFTIKPYGDQKLNLQTGVTVMDEGGIANDATRGVTVDAKYIEFRDNDYLRARHAKLTTRDGGSLTATNVEYTAKNGMLKASGNMHYNNDNVKGLTADSMTLDIAKRIGIATGNVKSSRPSMSANTVIVDYANERALMVGNYRYSLGGRRLNNRSDSAVLLVTWNNQGFPSPNSKPTSEQLAPFQPYLK